MSMAGYTKLFSTILASTIWREDDKTRIVWITLLAMADKNGIAEGSLPGLADLARVSLEECKMALSKLMSPDEYSRTTEYEGRRVQEVPGGWAILNHAKYRAKMNSDERREYNRLKQKEWRQKHASTRRQKKSITVNHCNRSSALSAHTEAEADTKEYSSPREPEEGERFSDWFKTLLPEKVKLSGTWRESWAAIYGDMIRLDGRTKEEVKEVCCWARSDNFWSANFLSPAKLRQKDGQGIQYFDVFKNRMLSERQPKNGNGKHVSKGPNI